MKGVVFTGFLEMVEQKYGYQMVDIIIRENELASQGAYTSIGTYDHAEIIKLLSSLSHHTKKGVPSLLKTFGHYFFDVLKQGYPQFLSVRTNAFDFLESIENYIHVEVKKLYPEAELPTFETKKLGEGQLEMIYQSERKMADFAEALIEKSMEHYGEKGTIRRVEQAADGSVVQFLITKG